MPVPYVCKAQLLLEILLFYQYPAQLLIIVKRAQISDKEGNLG